MKKFASIVLLGILCFNWIGFRFLSSYLEQKANVQLESRLDNCSYDESQLISIKVPAGHISSYTNANEFQRIDGQVEVNGMLYKFVKRRIFNDSLELLCIPNQQVMTLQNAKDDFFRLVNDLQHTGQGKKSDSHPGASKNLSSEYFTAVYTGFQVNRSSVVVLQPAFRYAENLPFIYSLTPEQPPEHC